MNLTTRRGFIKSAVITAAAGAIPVAASATQQKVVADPIAAAHVSLMEALRSTAPKGYKVSDMLFFHGNGILMAHAYPDGWEEGQRLAIYHTNQGGWKVVTSVSEVLI